jgi:hypothetical protein
LLITTISNYWEFIVIDVLNILIGDDLSYDFDSFVFDFSFRDLIQPFIITGAITGVIFVSDTIKFNKSRHADSIYVRNIHKLAV